jgi:hypothetical protein
VRDQYKNDILNYNANLTQRQTFAQGATARETLQRQEEQKLADAQIKSKVERTLGVPEEFVQKQIAATQEVASGAPNSAMALANAKQLLFDGKLYTGSGADKKLDMNKVAIAFGLPDNGSVPATEMFRRYMLEQVGNARKAMIGGSRVTNQEIQLVNQATGGISLDEHTLVGIINELQYVNRQNAIAYHRNVLNYAEARDAADPSGNAYNTLSKQMIPVEQMVPLVKKQHLDALLAQRDDSGAAARFDKSYQTPGLAQYILSKQRP